MVHSSMVLTFDSYAISDVGLVRENNEDSWSLISEKKSFLIADGMGGHLAGEVASQEVISFIKEKITNELTQELSELETENFLYQSILGANKAVWEHGQEDPECKGMGTTVCCLLFHEDFSVTYGHVGDSRIYLLRQGELEQITEDHSLLNDLLRSGELDIDDAKDFAYKNVLTMAMGTKSRVKPSVTTAQVKPGDLFMMCTDGLSDYVTHLDLEAVMNVKQDLEEMATTLVQLAKDAGGFDNITIVLVRVNDDTTTDLS
jgi:PPM family protein phosphatase